MKIGLGLLTAWLLYFCLGAFLNIINMPWWMFVFYGLLALGWSSEAARFVLGKGYLGFWFRAISWLIALAAILGLLVGIAYGLMAGNWVMGALVGLGMGTLAMLSVIISVWLIFDIFFININRRKSKLSTLKNTDKLFINDDIDNFNFIMIAEIIWVTLKGIGLAGVAVLGSYYGGSNGLAEITVNGRYISGVNGLTIAIFWALLLAGVIFITASELERSFSRFYTCILLFFILEIGLLSGWIVS